MRFINPIPFVRDINRSKEFYQKRLGLEILEDFGNFVLFETGFAVHEGSSLE
jgi:catechol 2,3-dioxygenase-like lactoylglutathione lyase family enzyme